MIWTSSKSTAFRGAPRCPSGAEHQHVQGFESIASDWLEKSANKVTAAFNSEFGSSWPSIRDTHHRRNGCFSAQTAPTCCERNCIDGTSSEVKKALVWHPFDKITSVPFGLAEAKATMPG